jgi:hypothetical protein
MDALKGMAEMLEQLRLKHIFIGMHFAVLWNRGHGEVPSSVEGLLGSKGSAVQSIDRVHLHASR